MFSIVWTSCKDLPCFRRAAQHFVRTDDSTLIKRPTMASVSTKALRPLVQRMASSHAVRTYSSSKALSGGHSPPLPPFRQLPTPSEKVRCWHDSIPTIFCTYNPHAKRHFIFSRSNNGLGDPSVTTFFSHLHALTQCLVSCLSCVCVCVIWLSFLVSIPDDVDVDVDVL
jgi:hypothetical protein